MARTFKKVGDRNVRGVAGQTIFDVIFRSGKTRNGFPQRVKDSYAK